MAQNENICYRNGTARLSNDFASNALEPDCRLRDGRNRRHFAGLVFPIHSGANASSTIPVITLRSARRINALVARGES
ncbi:hypothetical protein AAGS40_25135 (plasmid) [Paraburkholderia sp. PREW-6R]|uniref:hypothetical protein n=1 Tax=Paraburkholderia sp. PREW-6R TaxID=3141544 RepID=UPI0031F52C8E